jgi:hypothetical protein
MPPLESAMTKAAALNNSEADWWENPPHDVIPVLAANPDITIVPDNPMGNMTMVRFNHLLPPFDNPKMRQAVLMVTDQSDFMNTLVGNPKYWKVCPSFFTCGTPMASEAGSEALTGKRDFDKAKQLIKEAGYKGEKIVVLRGRSAEPARPGAGRLRSVEEAGAQRRAGVGRLGHRGNPPRLEEAAGGGRLAHLRDWLGRRRPARSVDQCHAARQWRSGLVRLAEGRQARRAAGAVDQGRDSG